MGYEEIFGTGVILNYLKERKYPTFMGELLFPETKIQDFDLEYIKGANRLPVSASIHSFNSETEIASRDALEKVKQSLALIKRKIKMDEKLLIKLQSPRNSAELEAAKKLYFNDVDDMVLAVKTRVEAMIMELISSGAITTDENGLTGLKLDYGLNSNQIKTLGGTSVWTDPLSDPLKDLDEWVDGMINAGVAMPTRALTSNAVMSALLRHEKVKKAVFGTNYDKRLSKNELNEFLTEQGLPKFATHDQRYRKQKADGTYETKRFYPDDKITLMPEYELGETVYGLTAEEVELQGKSESEIESMGNIIVQTYRTTDPVARWTKAVATALPTFPAAGDILIAKAK